ncbi:hypothetical protein BC831DRAFT_448937 [Entophlyctis helioformis]|nr:hypothetical protein BC831DRAFT_448937 [Entophlyctis helioformis]
MRPPGPTALASGFRLLPPLHDFFGRRSLSTSSLGDAVSQGRASDHGSIGGIGGSSQALSTSQPSTPPQVWSAHHDHHVPSTHRPHPTGHPTNHRDHRDHDTNHTSNSSGHHPHHPSDFYLNVGKATQVLRDDLPHFFEAGLSHTADLYARDIVFSEPVHSHAHISGLTSYRALAEAVRVSAKCVFEDVAFDVVGVRQTRGWDGEVLGRLDGLGSNGSGDGSSGSELDRTPGVDGGSGGIGNGASGSSSSGGNGDGLVLEHEQVKVVVRWLFAGRPRVSALMASPSVVEYEGVFVYGFDAHGRINSHVLQSIYPAPPVLEMCRWFKRPAMGVV